MSSEKPILRTLRKERNDKIAFWMMRQAGRYLPEYRAAREKAGSFLNLCYHPELAAEVTLQPIKRFSMDAAIIFSDILVVPHALGLELDYIEGEGPVLQKISDEKDIANLKTGNIEKHLAPVFEALKIVSNELPGNTALIGFAGAPWTVATYMVEGGSSKNFEKVKTLAYREPEIFQKLIDILIAETSDYLIGQVMAGAEVLQIFDSWAGILPEDEFAKWVIQPTKKIIANVKKSCRDIPIIGFPKGAGIFLEKYLNETGVDAVSLDAQVPIVAAKIIQEIMPIQGNLDPAVLLTDKTTIARETKKIKDALSGRPFIFNLGHGILPSTPIENVEAMIAALKN